MNNRTIFMIVDNQAKILENTQMDHREWCESLGISTSNFDSIVRGYVMDDKIIYFKGSSFNYDEEVYRAALAYSPSIRNYLQKPELQVCCGLMLNGSSKWEPILIVKESEIQNYNPIVEKKEVPKKETIETGPVIDFKNDYEDPKFIRVATIVTLVVIVLEIIIKMLLFKEQKVLQSSNPLDMLLSFTQIIVLVLSIYGYITKKSFAKYVSILASILIILTLDIYDIIIGILYFLFSIDQSYFIKLINLIKGLFKKGDKNV